jgi:hypothetical protein
MEAWMVKTSQWKNAERRECPRGQVQLNLALIYPQHAGRPARPMFQGRTRDLSLSGLSILVDYNIYEEGEVVVVLALPPAYAGAPRKVATSTAVMTHAIFSSKLNAYKIGLSFRKFRGNGKTLLAAALRRTPKEEAAAGLQNTSGRLSRSGRTRGQTMGR